MESMGPLANPFDPSQGFADDEHEKPYDPWEDEAAESEEIEEPCGVPGYCGAAREGQQVSHLSESQDPCMFGAEIATSAINGPACVRRRRGG